MAAVVKAPMRRWNAESKSKTTIQSWVPVRCRQLSWNGGIDIAIQRTSVL